MDNRAKKDWNEFRWEALIREDEKRIHCYFQELKQFLDLPNEEDMILDNMRTKSNSNNNNADLMTNEATSGNSANNNESHDFKVNQWLSFNEEELIFSSDDDDDDENDSDNNMFDVELWNNKDGAELFLLFEKLACRWSNIFAISLNADSKKMGLIILCEFGKLITRTTDMFTHNGENFPAFKRSILKRIHSEINNLIGHLLEIIELQKEIKHKINSLIDHLQNAREKIIDEIIKIK